MKSRLAVWCCALALLGCDKKSEENADEAAKKQAKAEPEAGDDAKPQSDGKAFTKDNFNRKMACDVLTADMVAKALEVPAGELKQNTVMGCGYQWENDTQQADAGFRMLTVYDDEETAKTRFANMTKGMSQEEIKAAMEGIKDKAEKDGAIKGAGAEKAADEIGGAVVDSAGAGGFVYEDATGIGDEARVLTNDGTVYVRVRNVTFTVTGFKLDNPETPPLDPKDPQGSIKKQSAALMQWVTDTAPQRAESAKVLAKAVVEAL